MSRGQIFGAVGAVIGFVAGGFTPQGAYYGYFAGSAIGALTAPTQRIEGPRIETTPITGAAEGDPIPTVIVNGRVGGCIAWCSPKRPVPHTTEQGKGGGGAKSTTFTSEWDMLIIVAGHQSAGVRRVWRLGELIWSTAAGADAQTLADSATTDAWRRMTVYTGGPGQMPDPVYEAFHGVGNVSVHRNVTSVFIEGYQSDFNGQYIPLSFEIGPGGDATVFDYTGEEQEYVVPEGVTSVAIQGWSGGGGAGYRDTGEEAAGTPQPGGNSGYAVTNVAVTAGEVLRVFVGGRGVDYQLDGNNTPGGWGYGDGGQGARNTVADRYRVGGSGGGSSAVLRDATPVWACGAGAGGASDGVSRGGHGGGLVGGGGELIDGSGGTQSAGGANGVGDTMGGDGAGPDGGGGAGNANLSVDYPTATAGGGGAGYFGGGGGATNSYDAGSGGGGSSLAPDGLTTAGANAGPAGSSSGYWDGHGQGGSQFTESTHGRVVIIAATAVPKRPLSEVLTELTAGTALLTANDVDVSDVADIMVSGVVLNEPTTTRGVIDKLLDSCLVECYEDDRIVFRKLGGDPAVTIPYRDLGASEGGEAPEPLPIGLRNDIEVPARIRGRFANLYNDFQVGLTPEGDRLTTDSLETRIVDLGLVLTPLAAARVIDVKTAQLTVERRSLGPIVVTRKYASLRPTNVVRVEDFDGSIYRARISKITDSGLLRIIELRPDDASSINSAADVDNTDYSQTVVRNNAPTEIEALDTPAFRDADMGPGHYKRVGAVGRWEGARLQVSLDDAAWSDVELVNQRATYGVATSALANFPDGNLMDERSSLIVAVTSGEFSSTTVAELIASRTRNLIVVGAQGREEALQYRTATPIDASTVRLTGFLRGRFGTEHAMASHQVGDHVVLMQPAGIVRVSSDISAVGSLRYYRAISFGKLASSANSESFVDGGASLRPYSAANPRVVRDSAGNAQLSCHRRTRATGRLFGPMGSAFPLGEATEAWLWEIYSDDTYTTVLRELSSAVSAVAYTAAQQVTDFGSAQAVIHARVYQLSESIGRGYPLEIAA